MLLAEGIERQPQAEAVRQGDLVLHGLVRMQFAVDHLPVLVVALALRHQMPAVRGGVQQHVFRCALQRAVEHALEHAIVALPGLERQVVAEQHERLRQADELFDHPRQVGQMVALDLDQPQPGRRVLGQQRTNQRRLAGTPRTPQQGVVGRQTVDELAGVGRQQITLAVDTDQVVQAQVEADFERRQIARARIALPACGQGPSPVDDRGLLRQQRFDTCQQPLGTLQKGFQLDIHERLQIRRKARPTPGMNRK